MKHSRKLTRNILLAFFSAHVDDLSHVLVAETKTELEEKCLAAGRLVAKEVKRLGLILSTKGKTVPVNILTRRVAKILTEEGIPLDTAKTADDVGVELSGGTTRADTTLDNRILKKGAPRANRVRGLVMINPEATKLAMSGVQPTQAYGHQAMGGLQGATARNEKES